ncbi:hypothetical protein TNIN_119211 [Trichonephila inaurata madagascariensis]|uniref:Uncharacterized protein n=1 Tax=Trichonephila inaurata madagascariensis TaxID=2747483 RepID=A0A8X6XAP6_9ARAC|nr:hypothetical protein TNIN_119211 [Trichonephila inaurata madagascariensis]
MDLNFDTLLDMEPQTPTRPSNPRRQRSVHNCSNLPRKWTNTQHFEISKFNDIQPKFQIELASKFNVLSQETAETLTTDLASTTIPNTVNAPLSNENTSHI